jgi:wobble nucleotide-excising tRNase
LQKTTAKHQEIQFANQLNKPADLNLPAPDLAKITVVLRKKIDSLHVDAEKKVKEHIEQHTSMPSTALPTINAVNNVRKGETCPFCGQDTSTVSELMEAYRVFFDKSYQDLQIETSAVLKLFISWDVDKTLKILTDEVEAWHAILNNQEIYNSLIAALSNTSLREHKNELQVEVEEKARDFNYEVLPGKIKNVSDDLDKIHLAIVAFNIAIAVFKDKVSSKKLEELKRELSKLETIQDRHTSEWDIFCGRFKQNEENAKKFKEQRENAIRELSTYSTAMFSDYQTSINTVLTKVGADFKIKDLSEQKDLRKSEAIFCGFNLEFFGKHTVGISDTEDKPHFKNTLSEGDKSSLAFALFISILAHNEELKNCLIVFDDPISSFDAERKKATAKLLFTLTNKKSERPSQTIILTHESNFLIRLQKEFGGEALYLKIAPNGLNGSILQSTIERLDVYNDFLKPESFEALDKIQGILDGTAQVDKKAHDDCRIILENALKAKYYLELKDDISKHTGITGYVKTLLKACLMTPSLASEFTSLLPDIHEPHHSAIEASTRSNSAGDIKDILLTSLNLLRRL